MVEVLLHSPYWSAEVLKCVNANNKDKTKLILRLPIKAAQDHRFSGFLISTQNVESRVSMVAFLQWWTLKHVNMNDIEHNVIHSSRLIMKCMVLSGVSMYL